MARSRRSWCICVDKLNYNNIEDNESRGLHQVRLFNYWLQACTLLLLLLQPWIGEMCCLSWRLQCRTPLNSSIVYVHRNNADFTDVSVYVIDVFEAANIYQNPPQISFPPNQNPALAGATKNMITVSCAGKEKKVKLKKRWLGSR